MKLNGLRDLPNFVAHLTKRGIDHRTDCLGDGSATVIFKAAHRIIEVHFEGDEVMYGYFERDDVARLDGVTVMALLVDEEV